MEVFIQNIRYVVLLLCDEGVRYVQFDDTTIGRIFDSIHVGSAFMSGYSEQVTYTVNALNRVIEGRDDLHVSLHLCGKLRWTNRLVNRIPCAPT